MTEKRSSHTLTPVSLLPAESQHVSAYILEERKCKGSVLCKAFFAVGLLKILILKAASFPVTLKVYKSLKSIKKHIWDISYGFEGLQ